MRFAVSCEISYEVTAPSTLLVNVHAMQSASQTILEETFVIEPNAHRDEFVSGPGQNRIVHVATGSAKELKIRYRAVVETHLKMIDARNLNAAGRVKLDRNVIPFLYPSRYCQSDKLGRLAFSKFGKIKNSFEKAYAVSTWIHENVQYLSGSTNWQTSASDTVTERAGVCRDFAHLGIALCRALNIPARYFAGYAHQLDPPDFHACFEAYIGQSWLLFDATKLVPVNGLVRIATGRDAADTSIATIFGAARSKAVRVSCEALSPGFIPNTAADLSRKGVCLDLS